MKFGKGSVTPQRDRPYWEPPRSAIGQINAHIEEIGADEPPERRPLTRRQRLSRQLWQRRAVVVIGAVVLVVIVAVGVDGSLASRQPHASPSSSALAALSSGALPSGSATLDSWMRAHALDDASQTPAQPLWTPVNVTVTYDPAYQGTDASPAPVVANGWPIKAGDNNDVDTSSATVGPDGTVYIGGALALNSSGHARNGWLQLANGDTATVVGFGTDGTIYATDVTQSSTDGPADTKLYAFSANGALRSGWPLDFGDSPGFEVGPAGSIYAFSDVNSVQMVTVLTSAGKTKSHWSIGSDTGGTCGDVIRSDGTLFHSYTASTGSDCSIAVYGPTGTRLSSNTPVRGWDDLVMSPGGTVIAVGYDYEPYSTSVVAQTRIAVIGTDGNPAPGWPISLEGAASIPAFGPDESLYVAQAGLGTKASQVTAYDQSGKVKTGWPVSLPIGYAPFTGGDSSVPLSLVVGDDGAVYVAATDSNWTGSVIAFDASGNVLPGWPYALPQAFAAVSSGSMMASATNPGPMFVTRAGGQGSLFLMLDGEIVALGSDGNVRSGWPAAIPDSANRTSWDAWAAVPDGGVVTISDAQGSDGVTTITIVRLTPAGTMAR